MSEKLYELRTAAMEAGDLGRAIRRTLRIVVYLLSARGDHESAVEELTWAIEQFSIEEAPHRKRLIRDIYEAHATRMEVVAQIPRFPIDRWLQFADEFEEFVKTVDKPQWQPEVNAHRATVLSAMGQIDEAIALLREALRIGQSVENDGVMPLDNILGALIGLLNASDRKDEAQELVRQWLDNQKGKENNADESEMARYARSIIGGDEKEAARQLERSIEEAIEELHKAVGDAIPGFHSQYRECTWLPALVAAKVELGKTEEAKARAERCLELATQLNSPPLSAWAYLSLARVAASMGQLAAWRYIKEARDLSESIADISERHSHRSELDVITTLLQKD